MADHYKYDGAPLIKSFRSPQNLKLYSYLWTPPTPSRFVVVLLHGIRAHTRLTWLAKRHKCLEGQSQYSVHDYTSHWSCPLRRTHYDMMADGEEENRSRNRGSDSDYDSPRRASMSSLASSGDLSTCVCSDDFDEVCSHHFPVLEPDSDVSDVSDEDRSLHVFYRGSWVEGFINNGATVFGLDMQGHGLSEAYENRRCYVRKYDDFRDDVLAFIETVVRPAFPDAPLFLVGVSMSGQVVMRIAQDERAWSLNILGIVSMAGMLAIASRFTKHPMKAVLKANCDIVSKIAPTMPIGKYRSDTAPHWQRSVGDRDPLLFKGSFTAKMVAESVFAIDQVQADMAKVPYMGACKHLLFLHNTTDPVCGVNGSLDAFHIIVKDLEVAHAQRDRDITLDSLTCILLNAQGEDDTIYGRIGDTQCKMIRDSTPLQIHHTMANDLDHAYVFGRLISWIERCLTLNY